MKHPSMKLVAAFRQTISAMRWAAVFLALLCTAAYADEVPHIAAASDLRLALSEVAGNFTRVTGKKVRLTFSSSGVLKTQIENGAPYQLFLSADEMLVIHLEEKGWTKGNSRLYATGRLALFVPHSLKEEKKADMHAMMDSLSRNRQITRFAIANPEHAPYGRAARLALQSAGIWDSLKAKLVFGESASQATQFVASGASQSGIIPLSLTHAPALTKLGSFHVIPREWHAGEPLHQRMVMLKGAGHTAQMFFDYMQGEFARSVLKRYGYGLPGERA